MLVILVLMSVSIFTFQYEYSIKKFGKFSFNSSV